MLKGKTHTAQHTHQKYALTLSLVIVSGAIAVISLSIVESDVLDYIGRSFRAKSCLPWREPAYLAWEDNWNCGECDNDACSSIVDGMKASFDRWSDASGDLMSLAMVNKLYHEWKPFGGYHPEFIIATIVDMEIYLTFSRHKGQDYYRVDGVARFLSDMLRYSVTHNHTVPNVQFLVNTYDSPVVSGDKDEWGPSSSPPLVFSTCTSSSFFDVSIPFPNTDPAVYRSLISQPGVSWNARSDSLFWRGSPTDGNKYLPNGKWREHARAKLVAMTDGDFIDCKFTSYIQVHDDAIDEMKMDPVYRLADRAPLSAIGRYKYAADLDGNTFTERTPSLMAQESLVFRQKSPWKVFYSPALKPWKHYVPLERDVSDAKDKVIWARSNDISARKMAQNGKKFVAEHLRRVDMACYWWKLVNEYAHHQQGEVSVPKDALLIPYDVTYIPGWLQRNI